LPPLLLPPDFLFLGKSGIPQIFVESNFIVFCYCYEAHSILLVAYNNVEVNKGCSNLGVSMVSALHFRNKVEKKIKIFNAFRNKKKILG
jgi:hypothetical protein